MLALMKTRHTDTQGEIMVNVPLPDMEKVSQAIRGVLELAERLGEAFNISPKAFV